MKGRAQLRAAFSWANAEPSIGPKLMGGQHMSGRNGLISTTELADILRQADLRLFDCTTYLEPAPEGSTLPYLAVPGRQTFEAGHIPGADFLDLQGQFSDASTELRFMMPDVAQLEQA